MENQAQLSNGPSRVRQTLTGTWQTNWENVMKNQIALAAMATCVSLGAIAQGDVTGIQNMFQVDGITAHGLNATNSASADTLASISYALPEMYSGFGSGTVPQFNPTNGQLISVSLTFGGAGMEGVEVFNFSSQQLYYWFCGVGTFSVALPGSTLAGSTSCSMSTNSGDIASGSAAFGQSYGSFNLGTNTSQAADLQFFTGTNSVTVNETASFSIECSGEGRHSLSYVQEGFSIMLDNSALTYYYTPQLPPIIQLTYAPYAVLPTFSNLIVGTNYQLQVSTDLTGTFTNYGAAFAATNSSMVYTQYFEVANWSQLFLRVKTSP